MINEEHLAKPVREEIHPYPFLAGRDRRPMNRYILEREYPDFLQIVLGHGPGAENLGGGTEVLGGFVQCRIDDGWRLLNLSHDAACLVKP